MKFTAFGPLPLYISQPFACPVSLHIHSSCVLRQSQNDEDHIEQLWNGITSLISSMRHRKPHVTTEEPALSNGNQHSLVQSRNTQGLFYFLLFFSPPFLYICLCLAVPLCQPLLADPAVNDGPRSGSEPWVDACLCDSCGVLSKTKAAWQAAALRLDQKGLVYWSGPLCSALLRSRVTAVRWVGEICSALPENGNQSDHTDWQFNHHKGKQKRLTQFGNDSFNRFMPDDDLKWNVFPLTFDLLINLATLPFISSLWEQCACSFFPCFPWCYLWNVCLFKEIFICHQTRWRSSLLRDSDLKKKHS